MGRYRGESLRKQYKPKPAATSSSREIIPLTIDNDSATIQVASNVGISSTILLQGIVGFRGHTPQLHVQNRYNSDVKARVVTLVFSYGPQVNHVEVLRIVHPNHISRLTKIFQGKVIIAVQGKNEFLEIVSLGLILKVEIAKVYVLYEDGPRNLSINLIFEKVSD